MHKISKIYTFKIQTCVVFFFANPIKKILRIVHGNGKLLIPIQCGTNWLRKSKIPLKCIEKS